MSNALALSSSWDVQPSEANHSSTRCWASLAKGFRATGGRQDAGTRNWKCPESSRGRLAAASAGTTAKEPLADERFCPGEGVDICLLLLLSTFLERMGYEKSSFQHFPTTAAPLLHSPLRMT
jgi:hypothetical protein